MGPLGVPLVPPPRQEPPDRSGVGAPQGGEPTAAVPAGLCSTASVSGYLENNKAFSEGHDESFQNPTCTALTGASPVCVCAFRALSADLSHYSVYKSL